MLAHEDKQVFDEWRDSVHILGQLLARCLLICVSDRANNQTCQLPHTLTSSKQWRTGTRQNETQQLRCVCGHRPTQVLHSQAPRDRARGANQCGKQRSERPRYGGATMKSTQIMQ